MKLLYGSLSFYTHEQNESKIEVGHNRSNNFYKASEQDIEQEEKEGRVKDLDHGTGASLVDNLLTAFIKRPVYERNFEVSELLSLLFSWVISPK